MSMKYVAGYNLPGYMPDSEPATFDDFATAQSYIVEEIDRDIESLYTGGGLDNDASAEDREAATNKEAQLKEAIEYVKKQTGEFSFRAGDYVYWVSIERQ